MPYTQTMISQSISQHYREVSAPSAPSAQRRHASKQRFVADLSQCLFDFVIQLLPTAEEMAVKEDVRKLLERLIRTIEPDSRLLSFGSTANGFSLRNSDMDLCCLIDSNVRLAAADLVTMLGDLLERETKFHVKPLPHARIPIVKLSLDPSPGLPLGIACDIGFENRLALENTRLLMCYAMIDATRVRTMVLFLKVWSKRRKINSPYKGTLSSYGYVLLVIYFLVHVKNPPVLPNLQQMPALRPISKEDVHLNGYNVWFFDDIELLRQRWHSENTETVAELLIDFFRYYSRDFSYNTGVASIRAGLLKKEVKGWQNDLTGGRYNDARERNRLCIEDPFETDYNVARCVTKDGLYTIRGELMRATRVLSTRPERAILALAELCEERKDEDLVSAPPFVSPRVSLPPQTPYTVGSQSMRPKGAPPPERLSPPMNLFEPGPRFPAQQVHRPPPPDHMAPRRSKWTSPPPPEASSDDHTLFESQLGIGLELATSSTEAREKGKGVFCHSPSSGSEHLTDEDRSDAAESDDVTSVRSLTEGSTTAHLQRRPSWHVRDAATRVSHPTLHGSTSRNRNQRHLDTAPVPFRTLEDHPPSRPESLKRPLLHRPSRGASRLSLSNTPIAVSVPLPPSPDSTLDSSFTDSSAIYYQTTVPRSPRPNVLYPSPGSPSLLSQYQMHLCHNINMAISPDILPPNPPPSIMSTNVRTHAGLAADVGRSSAGPETPTPGSYGHSHSSSSTTITVPTPPPRSSKPLSSVHTGSFQSPSPSQRRSPSPSRLRSPSSSPQPPRLSEHNVSTHGQSQFVVQPHDTNVGSSSPHPSSTSNSSSPTPSSTGYATSLSRSPSPHSPPTAIPVKEKLEVVLDFTTTLATKSHDGTSESGLPTQSPLPLVKLPLVEAGVETQKLTVHNS